MKGIEHAFQRVNEQYGGVCTLFRCAYHRCANLGRYGAHLERSFWNMVNSTTLEKLEHHRALLQPKHRDLVGTVKDRLQFPLFCPVPLYGRKTQQGSEVSEFRVMNVWCLNLCRLSYFPSWVVHVICSL